MAGPLDLTGQNIENTYQRILQTDGTLIYDGTGSLFNISGSGTSNTGSFTGSFTGSLEGTASYALQAFSSSYAETASYTDSALSASYSLTSSYAESASYAIQALNSTFSDTASYAIQALNSTFSDTASYALQALNSTLADTASYAFLAETSSFVQLIQGPGIIVNGLEITASVQSVNGIFPTNGNISTALTATITGTSASLVVSSSGNVTASLPDGLVWIISNDPTASNNGDSYIFSSGSVGQWYPISTLDVAAADTRYLKLDASNGPMTGNLSMGGYNINNVGTMTGTASYALQTLSSSYALSASYAPITTFPYTGNAVISGSLIVTGSAEFVGRISQTGLGSSIFIGQNAGFADDLTTNVNVAIGNSALRFNKDGTNNVAIGESTLFFNTGSNNVALGAYALQLKTIGGENMAIGTYALNQLSTGSRNVAVGVLALFNAQGSFNVGIGSTALYDVTGGLNSGRGNIGIGQNTGRGITTGEYNTIIGASVTGLSSSLSNNIIIADGVGNIAFRVNPTTGLTGLTRIIPRTTTNQTAATEISAFIFNGVTTTWQTGTIATQRNFYLPSQTYAFNGASTITNAYGLYAEAPIAGTNATITNRYAAGFSGSINLIDTSGIAFGTTTGGKIGTATTQKLSFWNATPIVQPTTAIAAATLVSGGGTALTNTDTFDGYTLQQVVKALRDAGLLA